MKIIISHSGKQYVHRLIKALVSDQHEVTFYTLFWYEPKSLFWKWVLNLSPNGLANKLRNELNKKKGNNFDKVKVIQAPIIEFLRKLLIKSCPKNSIKIQYWADRKHDEWVAKAIRKREFDLFIGYEMSSLESFKVAKLKGAITVLDLAQIHYKEIEELAMRHPSLSHLIIDAFRKSINKIKEEEYHMADHILTISSFAHHSMLKYGIPAQKLEVINLGFNENLFQYKPKILKTDHFNLLFVGAIIKRKGIVELHQALNELAQEKDFKFQLTLIGGMNDDIFQDHLYDLKHYPFMHHEEIVQQYQDADLFIFPSLLDSWAMVVLESMACGTPVIITENTGAKDAVIKYGGGMLVEAGDVSDLKKAILNYFTNPAKIIKDSNDAKNAVKSHTWNNYNNNISDWALSLNELR